jgi:hypothetical protein
MKAMQLSKQCSTCRRVKLLKDFYRNITEADGLQHSCKECKKSDERKRNKNKRPEDIPEVYELGENEQERDIAAYQALTELTE